MSKDKQLIFHMGEYDTQMSVFQWYVPHLEKRIQIPKVHIGILKGVAEYGAWSHNTRDSKYSTQMRTDLHRSS